MIDFDELVPGQMFFLTATKDVFFVKQKESDKWLVRCWWGNESGKKFYYSLNDLHYDEVDWYETLRAKKHSDNFSLLPSIYQRKLLKAILSLDDE
jgi:aminopeptidase C